MRKEYHSLLLGSVITVIVLVVVVAGFLLLGSPGERRKLTLDAQRVSDLSQIASTVHHVTRSYPDVPNAPVERKPLPATIEELGMTPGPQFRMADPSTGAPYVYRPDIAKREYELCATFERPSPPLPSGLSKDFWEHPAGEHCYRINADADPVYPMGGPYYGY